MGSSLPNMEPVDPDAPKEGPPSSAHRAAAEDSQPRARPLAPKERPKIRPSPNETPTRPRGIEAVKPTHRLNEVPKDRETQPSMQAVKLAEQESRIARARLGAETAPPPAHPSEGATKIVQHAGAISSLPPAEALEDDEDPIAKMRALYAQGDAAAALALATELTAGFDAPPPAQIHSTAPPLVLEPGDLVATVPPRSGPSEPAPFSDVSIEVEAEDDPYGGLIPVEDEESEEPEEVGDLLDEDDPFGGLVEAEPDPMDPISHSGIVAAGRLPVVAVTPRLLVDAREIPSLPIDPRGAFMLTLVDGIQSLEEILDICAMPQDEALELIEKLRLMGVIEI